MINRGVCPLAEYGVSLVAGPAYPRRLVFALALIGFEIGSQGTS